MTDLVSITLVTPQMGENIGAAARAMANFELSDLRLVNPRDGWPNEAATANSAGAFDIIPDATLFTSVEHAVSTSHIVYATTARPRDMRKEVLTPQAASKEIAEHIQNNQKISILFGGERAGLTNDEISYAQKIISVPLSANFSSINLGQSVLLMVYELFQARHDVTDSHLPDRDSAPTTQEELNGMLNRLENELAAHGFFRNPDMKPTMVQNIRNMFGRSNLSEQEVRTIQGIISALVGNKKGR